MAVVYGLFRESTKEMFYVGLTKNLRFRLAHHRHRTFNNLRGDFYAEVLEADANEDVERFWIQYARSMGCQLYNKKGLTPYVPKAKRPRRLAQCNPQHTRGHIPRSKHPEGTHAVATKVTVSMHKQLTQLATERRCSVAHLIQHALETCYPQEAANEG